ncbi:hypothetical protein P7K49_029639 [Saguinus oedipus]|uniref:WASH1 WAHD domain-containing protein n=1 Tax=Saguinus oedipus TaxID=9490 RepID=A0ABQ9U7R2_SAGOE|nr:hypothetical protein P7K49_029639 [Saguinus oedipus]
MILGQQMPACLTSTLPRYKKSVCLDQLASAVTKTHMMLGEETEEELFGATLSINKREQLEQQIPENYMKDLGQVPKVDVPSYLPDLPGRQPQVPGLPWPCITQSAPGMRLKPLNPTAAVLVRSLSSPAQATATAVLGTRQDNGSSISFRWEQL